MTRSATCSPQAPLSVERGYKAGRFSFNVKGGRCEECQGEGVITTQLYFMPDVEVTCGACKGARFNSETLEVTLRGKTIDDVLNMSVEEGAVFFAGEPVVGKKIEVLNELGLGYLTLGQSATTLSGGEAQRIKVATELSKLQRSKHTVYILDEPTTGLHLADVQRLLESLNRLVDAGHTVLLIEHHLDVIKTADHVIDLGPEGGHGGGELVVTGTPEEVAACKASHTGSFLKAQPAGMTPMRRFTRSDRMGRNRIEPWLRKWQRAFLLRAAILRLPGSGCRVLVRQAVLALLADLFQDLVDTLRQIIVAPRKRENGRRYGTASPAAGARRPARFGREPAPVANRTANKGTRTSARRGGRRVPRP